jgi:CMP-N-acetylneuraminic acid synthetase
MKDKPFILIPAKGQSSRLVGKNMKLLGERTLVYHAVRRSLLSGIGDVYVSTESQIVAKTIRIELMASAKKITIIERPQYLSKSSTRVFEVCKHAIKKLKKKEYTTLIMTLPSTPLLTGSHMKEAYDQYIDSGRFPLFCLTKVEKSATILLKQDSDGFICAWGDSKLDKVVQGDYGEAYVDNGGILICDIDQFLEVGGDYYSFCALQGYVVSADYGLDIDTPLDFLVAESILKWKNSK